MSNLYKYAKEDGGFVSFILKNIGLSPRTISRVSEGKKIVIPRSKSVEGAKSLRGMVKKHRTPGISVKSAARREVKILKALGDSNEAFQLAGRLKDFYKAQSHSDQIYSSAINNLIESGESKKILQAKIRRNLFNTLSDYTANRERELKNLSDGRESLVHKVFSPEYGIAVRKVHTYPSLKDRNLKMHEEIKHLQDIGKTDYGYARVLGTDPRGIIFQEYLSPTRYESFLKRIDPNAPYNYYKEVGDLSPEQRTLVSKLKELRFIPWDYTYKNRMIDKETGKSVIFDMSDFIDMLKHLPSDINKDNPAEYGWIRLNLRKENYEPGFFTRFFNPNLKDVDVRNPADSLKKEIWKKGLITAGIIGGNIAMPIMIHNMYKKRDESEKAMANYLNSGYQQIIEKNQGLSKAAGIRQILSKAFKQPIYQEQLVHFGNEYNLGRVKNKMIEDILEKDPKNYASFSEKIDEVFKKLQGKNVPEAELHKALMDEIVVETPEVKKLLGEEEFNKRLQEYKKYYNAVEYPDKPGAVTTFLSNLFGHPKKQVEEIKRNPYFLEYLNIIGKKDMLEPYEREAREAVRAARLTAAGAVAGTLGAGYLGSELAKRRAEKSLYSEFGIEKPKNGLNTQAIGEQLRRLVSREKPHYEL